MKIVRIIARLNVGGPARHVIWLTSELQDDEFESVLVAGTVPAGEEDMSYLLESGPERVVYIREMSRELSLKDVVAFWKLFRILRRESPDIVHTHTAKAGTVGRLAALAYKLSRPSKLFSRKGSLSVVHTFHGHVFHSYYSPIKTKVFVLIERLLARFATDKIITISAQQRNEILERFRIGSPAQFEVIPLGIDLDSLRSVDGDRERVRAEIGANADEIVVGFVGRLTEIKNIPMLISAAGLYAKSAQRPKLRFVIVGDGHLRSELEKDVALRGLSNHVRFLGNRTDVAAVYAGLDIVALTSLNEGTPLSLLEAMGARRPFVSTSVGGVVDLVGDFVGSGDGFDILSNGITTNPDNVVGYLAGLLYLAENEKLRQSMAISGRRFVEEHYGKERLVNDMKDLYRSMAR